MNINLFAGVEVPSSSKGVIDVGLLPEPMLQEIMVKCSLDSPEGLKTLELSHKDLAVLFNGQWCDERGVAYVGFHVTLEDAIRDFTSSIQDTLTKASKYAQELGLVFDEIHVMQSRPMEDEDVFIQHEPMP